MFINKGDRYWTSIDIEKAEKHFNAKYINDLSINQGVQWTDVPVSVFYAYDPHESKGHKRYFGLFIKNDKVAICDATTAAVFSWSGMHIIETGEIIFSRWTHDFRSISVPQSSLLKGMGYENMGATYFVDGGHDYGRFGGNQDGYNHVDLKIIGDEMVVLDTVVHQGDIFPDYACTYKNDAYYLAVIGFPDRIEKFDNWLKEHTASAVLDKISDWTYFSDRHAENYDVVLKVSFANETDRLMFKLKFDV